ncbi:MAG: MBL fold metallo-hydrolase [Acidimicrobiales bacterium]
MVIEPDGEEPIVLDLGTGLRYYGEHLAAEGVNAFVGTALLTHLHWDHVQGIPFFTPLLDPRSNLRLVGPAQTGSTLAAEVERFVKPPLFPVHLDVLPGSVEFVEADSGEPLDVGSCTITAASVPHCGATNGYRIQNSIGSVAYISDHQQPADGSFEVPDEVVKLCKDVDVLIHDAQYSAEEFAGRLDWGHSTPEYALEVARVSGASRLVLFHHDPSHSDEWVRNTESKIAAQAQVHGIEVLAAYEGLQLTSG